MPVLSPDVRAQLARVLALPVSASDRRLAAEARRLRAALEARRRALPGGSVATSRLEEEIASLDRALSGFEGEAETEGRTRPGPPDRLPLLGALAGVLLAAAVLFAQAIGNGPAETATRAALPPSGAATLVLEGPLAGATLRVLDADRSRVLIETAAHDAEVSLERGRYAIEVTREGCPEAWTRSVWFEAGTTRRLSPALCTGEGRLRVRANVEGATIAVDGVALGPSDQPAIELAVGEYEVTVAKPGYQPHTGRIRIRADETQELRADLVPERIPANLARRLDPSFDTEALAAPETAAPAPFDLDAMAASLAPERSPEAGTRLLEREGLGRLPDGGSTAWHDRVSQEFLRRFDGDASGRIDSLKESEAISCAYWRETEASFDRGGLGLSMARYYGFDGSEWHRGALGFDRDVRGAAYARMRECGLQA